MNRVRKGQSGTPVLRLVVALTLVGAYGCSDKLPESNQLFAHPIETWSIGSNPVFAVAQHAGDSSLEVVGATLTTRRAIVVGDSRLNRLVLFNERGLFVRDAEYPTNDPKGKKMLRWLGRCPGSPLVVAEDLMSRQLMFFSEDLILHKVFVVPPGFIYARPVGCFSDSTITAIQRDPLQFPPKRYGADFPAATLIRFRSNHNTVDTLRKLSGTDFFFARRVNGYADQPLGRSTFFASGRELTFVGSTESRAVDVFDSTGKPSSSIDLGIEPRVATVGDLESWVAARMHDEPFARTRKLLRSVLTEAPVRSGKVRYAALMADRPGNLWVKSYDNGVANTFRWFVYTSAGAPLAIVDVPASLRLLEIGDDYLLASDKDSVNIDRVVLLSLMKRVSTSPSDTAASN